MLISVPYHLQDDDDFCGAAVAMMLLHGLNAPLTELKQEWLFAQGYHLSRTKKDGKNFAIGPRGLSELLNSEIHSRRKMRPFVATPFKSKEEALAFMRSRVCDTGWPALTLLYGGHWVCVRGFVDCPDGRTFVAFNSSDTSNECDGVPPHDDDPTSTCCGPHGRAGSATSEWREIAQFSESFQECQDLLDLKQPGFVVIAGNDACKNKGVFPLPEELSPAPCEESSEGLVVRALRLGLDDKSYGLAYQPGPEASARDFRLLDDERKIVGLSDAALPRFVDGDRAVEIARRRLGIPELDVTVGETLEWKFCRESRTPFLPFWHLTVRTADEGEVRIFVRIDGAVFTELTATRPGG